MNIFEYLLDPTTWLGPGNTLDLLLEHLAYTAAAVGLGALIAIPLGILIGHTGRGSFLVIGLTNGARAIPSLGGGMLDVHYSLDTITLHRASSGVTYIRYIRWHPTAISVPRA